MKNCLEQIVFFLLAVANHGSYQFSIRGAHVSSNLIKATAARDGVPRSCTGRMGPKNPCIQSGDNCFCFASSQKNWKDAFQSCQANAMSLLSIDSYDKQLETQKILAEFTSENELVKEIGVWTSGTFIRAIGTFAWASNLERFSFANWMYGSPMMSTFECVRMAPSASFQWQDIGCEQRLPYVCESTEQSTPDTGLEIMELEPELESETFSKPEHLGGPNVSENLEFPIKPISESIPSAGIIASVKPPITESTSPVPTSPGNQSQSQSTTVNPTSESVTLTGENHTLISQETSTESSRPTTASSAENSTLKPDIVDSSGLTLTSQKPPVSLTHETPGQSPDDVHIHVSISLSNEE